MFRDDRGARQLAVSLDIVMARLRGDSDHRRWQRVLRIRKERLDETKLRRAKEKTVAGVATGLSCSANGVVLGTLNPGPK